MIFAEHFLDLANRQLEKNIAGFDDAAREKLKDYYWHGNLRELQNVIKRSVLLTQGDLIEQDVLPREIITPQYLTAEDAGVGVAFDVARTVTMANGQSGANLKSVSENAERAAILKVLEKTGYNKTKAAEVLNIDRKTLYNKLKAYDIHL